MSSKPRPVFIEMPWNIKQDIIDSTDFKTRCVLRKCSKVLRCQVNNSDADLLSIKFRLNDNRVKVTMTNDDEVKIEVDYRLEVDGCSVNGKFIRGENYIDRSVADFAAVARHPRTFVGEMLADDHYADYGNKFAFLRAFEREFTSTPLRIKALQLLFKLSQQDHMRMLTLTCPGVLKVIGLDPIDEYQDMSQVITSEHWKEAKGVVLGCFLNLPAQSLTRFTYWIVDGIKITLEGAKVLVEKIFEFGESFIEWDIRHGGELDTEAFNYFLSEFAHRIEGVKHYFFKKMPGTMFHLRINTETIGNKTWMTFLKVLSSEVEV